jgi:hypothetical protein
MILQMREESFVQPRVYRDRLPHTRLQSPETGFSQQLFGRQTLCGSAAARRVGQRQVWICLFAASPSLSALIACGIVAPNISSSRLTKRRGADSGGRR